MELDVEAQQPQVVTAAQPISQLSFPRLAFDLGALVQASLILRGRLQLQPDLLVGVPLLGAIGMQPQGEELLQLPEAGMQVSVIIGLIARVDGGSDSLRRIMS
jgi:hypothetical protein